MKRLSSRRQRLALGASAVAALVALLRKFRRRKGGIHVPDEEPATTSPVVTVRLERKGQPYTGKADVSLTDGATTLRLQPVGVGTHRAEARPGAYQLVVNGLDAGAVVPERAVEVSASGTWPVDVLSADEPFIRLGKAVIPFRARTDLVSVAIGGHGQAESVRRLTGLVVERLGWKRVNPDSGEADDRLGDDDGLVSFQATAGAGSDNDIAVLRRLASEAGIDAGSVRVGFLIEGDRPQRAMLDGEFVLRFDPSFVGSAPDGPGSGPIGAAPAGTAPAGSSKADDPASPAAADDRPIPERVVTLLRDLKAELVQPVRGLPLTYLVRFADRDFRRHLQAVERLVREGVLLYGEPNLAARIRDTFSLTDYQANRNGNLDRMGIETAWTVALAAPAPAVPVKIGTLDRGIDTTSKFVDDLQLFDSALNNTPSQVPENDGHGMKVASIASGNGTQGCWGIAPFLAHVAIKRTSTTDVRYWDAFDLGFVPLGVKVISISHESEWLCADQTSQDKVSGYVNAGHVIVVASGNDDRRLDRLPGAPALVRPDVPFGGNQLVSCPLAAHPRTITVGNTMLNTIQAETFWKVSGANPAQGTNRGDFVDVCAFGDGSRAFGPVGGTAFTGTSAAAPLVAGTVALMRHVNPDLTVGQIRAILCTEIDLVQPTDPQWLTIAPTWASPGADWDFTLAPLVGKHNLRYGFGRVNVGKAVTKARSLKP